MIKYGNSLCSSDRGSNALNDASFVNVMHGPSEESDSDFSDVQIGNKANRVHCSPFPT